LILNAGLLQAETLSAGAIFDALSSGTLKNNEKVCVRVF
jgi:hypothetical protein